MTIIQKRTPVVLTPTHVAVQKWLSAALTKALAQASTEKDVALARYRYDNIPDTDIWVEYVRQPVLLDTNQYLCCFTLLNKGYGIIDAKLTTVSFSALITHFAIPVKRVSQYSDVVTQIRAGLTDTVYFVTSSQRYGIPIDNRLSSAQRHQGIVRALNNVTVNVAVSYTGETFTAAKPYVGELSLTWPGLTTTVLDIFPLEEIVTT